MSIWTKLYRYYNTVKYLKLEQIIYQLRYRIFGFRKQSIDIKCETYNKEFSLAIPELDFDENYINRFKVEKILQNEITLLNEVMQWETGKWVDSSKTHLWNFNLHYFEYGIALVQKYKEKKENSYLEKFKELYLDWHKYFISKKNSDAWHPYTVSLRIKNLLICVDILKDEMTEDDVFFDLLIQDIYVMYLYLIKNQEKNLLGNHYFENLTAIYIASIFFAEKKVSHKFEKKIQDEISEQILEDGIHYERSMMYHNLILEDLLRIYVCANKREQRNDGFMNLLQTKIYQMSDAVYSLEFRNSERIPLFNDAGSNVSKTANQLLIAVKEMLQYIPIKKCSFKNAGYFSLENEELKVIFDCGEIAADYISGHGQCDALSFEMYYKNIPVFVNAGTFQYQTKLRQFFRSDVAHNTLQVNNTNQSEVWGEHRTARRVEIEKVIEHTPNKVYGKIRTYQNALIQRKLELKNRVLKISDEISITEDKSNTVIRSYFRVHPDFKVENGRREAEKIITHKKSNLKIYILTLEGKWILHKTDICHYAEQFGILENTEVLELYQEISYREFTQNVIISIAEENTDD